MNIESNVGCSQGLSSNTSNSVKCIVVKAGRNEWFELDLWMINDEIVVDN